VKFQLFGRLRGNDDDSENVKQEQEPGMNQENDFQDFSSSGIQRTVENLFEQGYSEEEVRQELQGQYSRDEIQGAINQAVKTSATAEQEGPQPMTPYQENNQSMGPNDELNNQTQGPESNQINSGNPEMNQTPQAQNPPAANPPPKGNLSGNSSGNVEELIETIVAENFERVENEFENVYSEIDALKERAEDFEQLIHDLEVRDDEDDKQVIQKMDDIEGDIEEYQSRIGGLEKAFQQVLPSLVDNVRDLTSLVQEIKQERGIETSSDVDQDDIEDIDMEDW